MLIFNLIHIKYLHTEFYCTVVHYANYINNSEIESSVRDGMTQLTIAVVSVTVQCLRNIPADGRL